MLLSSCLARGGIEGLTICSLAVLIYVFLGVLAGVLARVNPQAPIKYPLALLAPAEQRRLVIGNRALLAFTKAEMVALFATMFATGLDRTPRGEMTLPLAAVLIGFTAVLLGTVLAGVIVLRPRTSQESPRGAGGGVP